MKKTLLYGTLFMLGILLSNCDNEELINTKHQQFKTTTFPLTTSNPYDEIGELHNVLFDTYLATPNTSDTIEDIATEVNNLISLFANLPQTTISIDSLFTGKVEQFIRYPEQSLDTIVSQIGLSTTAKSKLLNLIEITSGITTTDINEALFQVVTFEEQIFSNTILSTREKEIIFKVSSIAKYSLYDNGDRKDKDWDLSVGNIVASTYGANNNSQDALLLALTVKIYLNNLRTGQ